MYINPIILSAISAAGLDPKILKDNERTEKHETFNIKTKQYSPEIKNTST